MTYATPELLLVGAAQHLVQFISNDERCVYTNDVHTQSDFAELW